MGNGEWVLPKFTQSNLYIAFYRKTVVALREESHMLPKDKKAANMTLKAKKQHMSLQDERIT